MTKFKRTIGIDYSGAKTPTAILKGLRIFMVEGDARPSEVLPPRPRRLGSDESGRRIQDDGDEGDERF